MKSVSLHLNACDNVFDPGLRLRPFELVIQRGTPRESKLKISSSINNSNKKQTERLTEKQTTTSGLVYQIIAWRAQ